MAFKGIVMELGYTAPILKGFRGITMEMPPYQIPSINLEDKLDAVRHIDTIQVSNVQLYTALGVQFPYPTISINFPANSLTALETNIPFAYHKQDIRLRCDIAWTDPVTGENFNRHYEDLQPV